MEYRKAKTVSDIFIAVAVVLWLSLFLFTESSFFNTMLIAVIILGLGLVTAAIILLVIYYRCPHCHRYIRVRGRTPDYCPCCGEAL